MQRQGNLFERIYDISNLEIAYLKARKGKLGKKEVYEYGRHLDTNLKKLRQEMISGNISTGNYRQFTVHDPKERQIFAAPFHQRVMHHALMNVCHPYFERAHIHDSYASRIGKGTSTALERTKLFCRKYDWFLKLDVRKFFDSINHTVLKTQLKRLFKDKRLLGIFNTIIDSYKTEQCNGLPIGNLTSQYFANHYLTCVDHYIKEKLGIVGYIRYMDDMVLWHNEKDVLKKVRSDLKRYLDENCRISSKFRLKIS